MSYSSYSSQKTSAAFVTAVTCSFYPSVTLESIECDAQGFDLLFVSTMELNEPLLQVLQEEIRRKKSKVQTRFFTMMPSLIEAYAREKGKQIGPLSLLHKASLHDVCEIDSYLCLLEGPHDEEDVRRSEIVLSAFSSYRRGKRFVWHVRGFSASHKKEAKVLSSLQKKAWDAESRDRFEREGLAVFCEKNMLVLPKGMKAFKKAEQAFCGPEEKWIEASFLPFPFVGSDNELICQLLERKKILGGHISFDQNVMERVLVSREASFRAPAGFLSRQTALVRYCFSSETSLGQEMQGIVHDFRAMNFPFTLKLIAKNQVFWHQAAQLVKPFLGEDIALEKGEEVRELKEYSCLFFQSELIDGRKSTLAACVLEGSRKRVSLVIPALSLERSLGFSLETQGMQPGVCPF